MNTSSKRSKTPTLESLTANHIGMSVTDYRKLRAEANKAKKEAQSKIVKDLSGKGYTNKQIGMVMEITEGTVRGILSR